MEKMRKEFEAWVISHAESISYKYIGRVLLKDSVGGYLSMWVDSAWIGWNASRAALCIDLPKQWVSREYDDEIMNAGEVIESLENAGVSFK